MLGTENSPQGNNGKWLSDAIGEIRDDVRELRVCYGEINTRLAKLPCDVQDERHRGVERRIADLEDWRKTLWRNIMVFVSAVIGGVQAVAKLWPK